MDRYRDHKRSCVTEKISKLETKITVGFCLFLFFLFAFISAPGSMSLV